MLTIVIYDSKFGNTERIAEAIGRGAAALSDVRVVSTTDVLQGHETLAGRPDLLLVGGPTHNRGPSAGLRSFLDAVPAPFRGASVGYFDTRYRGPALLMGSAAAGASKALAKAGATSLAQPESFFIERHGPMPLQQLERGEIERAEAWGRAMATAAAAARPGRSGAIAR